MQAEWSVECGAEDPVLVVPWSDPSGLHFVDLRENPYDLDLIAEAEHHPPLLQALRALNAARSPVFTAKCDAWKMDDDERRKLQADLDLPISEKPKGFASYIDLVWRERALFLSFHQQEQRLQRLVRLLKPLDFDDVLAEAVVRPALVDLTGPQEGFAVTLYVKAIGVDHDHAYELWGRALEAIVAVLRSKELSLA
jgi:hypothetical protein